MKAFLLFKDRDFDLQQPFPSNEEALVQDLELNTLFGAMGLGDEFLVEAAKKAILSGLSNEVSTILYRQDILKDCLKNPSIAREIYDTSVEAIEREKKNYWSIFKKYPSSILHSSIDVLQMLVVMLRKLRTIADEHADQFESEGFTAFFAMLKRELGDDYFVRVENHLKELKFRDGVLISAELGRGNKGTHYILRKSEDKKLSWIERVFAKKPPVYTFNLHPRDENGFRALSELKDRGINLVANALAQSADHILSFFRMLRTELAFYIGCLNLHKQLAQIGEPMAFPLPVVSNERRHSFNELYDVCLALTMKQKIVGSDVNADHKDLVIITGANQGGKSTFLRSIGLSQLMMQCGMFVPAESFCSNICDSLFTHYKREEDATMKSGKLDEELGRMSDIVDKLTPRSMVLFNESFAATNEREGSEIARQIVRALLERGLKIFFVTHLYEFAHAFVDRRMENAFFLRAERQADGSRTFKLVEGEPLQTSYGEDLYNGIFGNDHSYREGSVVPAWITE
jgi:DNA mismatch repair ATPase MutS